MTLMFLFVGGTVALAASCGSGSDGDGDAGTDTDTDGDVDGDADGDSESDADRCDPTIIDSSVEPVDLVEGDIPSVLEVETDGLTITARWVEENADWRTCAGGEIGIRLDVEGTRLVLSGWYRDSGFSCDIVDALHVATVRVCSAGSYRVVADDTDVEVVVEGH
jgi:hypothetical protein